MGRTFGIARKYRRKIICAILFGVGAELLVGASARADDPPVRVGMEIYTNDQDPAVAADTIVIRYTGPIAFPLAENLAEVWQEAGGKYAKVVFELDSGGGELGHTKQVITVLAGIRRDVILTTYVRGGNMCASACIPVYMQGETRIASGASAWMFHGVCASFTNIPSETATRSLLDMLSAAGVGEKFLCALKDGGALDNPGQYWLSGYELFHTEEANVIQELTLPWQPEPPLVPPFDPALRPR